MKRNFTELLGWYGVVAILAAYFLNIFNLLSTSSIYYSILNLTGALGIVIDAWKQKDYQPMVLNVVWGLVALIALLRVLVH